MMKKFIPLFILVMACRSAFAQKEQVVFDEHDRYIFYQVVDMPGISADTLYSRCIAGLSRIGPKPLERPAMVPNTSINIKAKMMLYSSTGALKHEEGELTYTLHIDFRDNKYRFWLNDFIIAPYQRNRYSVYERAHEDPITLEDIKKRKDAGMFDTYLEQIAKFGNQFGADMKKLVANPIKKLDRPTKINTQNW